MSYINQSNVYLTYSDVYTACFDYYSVINTIDIENKNPLKELLNNYRKVK